VWAVNQPDDLHEWISFEDEAYEQTWMIDSTFMRSNWTCIYGSGCKGVLDDDATALQQGCCSYGAHFLDAADLRNVRRYVKKLSPEVWQKHKEGRDDNWLKRERDGAWTTRVVRGACIFHNEPGFAGGSGCAFHIAAQQAGERPLDWKPDVCWQVSLRLEEIDDSTGYRVAILREWKRRDWDEGGADFHWWCTDAPDAFVGKNPVYRYLKDEIIELVGPKVYAEIVRQLEAPRTTPLPHPQVRRRTKTRATS